MRYAVFSDIHANLEALETVLAKIDELAQENPIDQLWFLGDLVGYGPNPNECIAKLRERTDVMIAGNHDWAAVGKIDLEDFSAAARISAEWTAEQLTEENRNFLINLPERLEIDECTLVHGSPYGPLWEYLTSEVLAERSFQHFNSRFCFIGHTHVPVIFQQLDSISNTPTLPLDHDEQENIDDVPLDHDDVAADDEDDDDETTEMVVVRPLLHTTKSAHHVETAVAENDAAQAITTDIPAEAEETQQAMHDPDDDEDTRTPVEDDPELAETPEAVIVATDLLDDTEDTPSDTISSDSAPDTSTATEATATQDEATATEDITPEDAIINAEDRLNNEIEELLALLGLSQSMIKVTNEMIVPPEGDWQPVENYRAIVNPGGVGQPRDGDPRAAFMIYDTEHGFTFYRIAYPFEKTQEKIIKAGLPQYLAARLAYGR